MYGNILEEASASHPSGRNIGANALSTFQRKSSCRWAVCLCALCRDVRLRKKSEVDSEESQNLDKIQKKSYMSISVGQTDVRNVTYML